MEKSPHIPREKPTGEPTEKPTRTPTAKPTQKTKKKPTVEPTDKPASTPTLTSEETQQLKEILSWWKAHGSPQQEPTGTPTLKPTSTAHAESPRSRRHILIADTAWQWAKKEAKRNGVSVGELIEATLRTYMEE